jgi:hypothetical protein
VDDLRKGSFSLSYKMLMMLKRLSIQKIKHSDFMEKL